MKSILVNNSVIVLLVLSSCGAGGDNASETVAESDRKFENFTDRDYPEFRNEIGLISYSGCNEDELIKIRNGNQDSIVNRWEKQLGKSSGTNSVIFSYLADEDRFLRNYVIDECPNENRYVEFSGNLNHDAQRKDDFSEVARLNSVSEVALLSEADSNLENNSKDTSTLDVIQGVAAVAAAAAGAAVAIDGINNGGSPGLGNSASPTNSDRPVVYVRKIAESRCGKPPSFTGGNDAVYRRYQAQEKQHKRCFEAVNRAVIEQYKDLKAGNGRNLKFITLWSVVGA